MQPLSSSSVCDFSRGIAIVPLLFMLSLFLKQIAIMCYGVLYLKNICRNESMKSVPALSKSIFPRLEVPTALGFVQLCRIHCNLIQNNQDQPAQTIHSFLHLVPTDISEGASINPDAESLDLFSLSPSWGLKFCRSVFFQMPYKLFI